MKVRVDPNSCVLTGLCAAVAPEVFDVDGDADSSQVILEEVTDAELSDRVREAALGCPVAAITASAD
jgi:ferredoxin